MDESGPPDAIREGGLSASILVLNRNYAPIRIISARRAFVLLTADRAEVIDHDQGQYVTFDFRGWLLHSSRRLQDPVDHELFVHTPNRAILVPKVIRLVLYDKLPRREVKFNRRNVLARDEHHCQYCGRKYPTSRLSLDHVVPRSRGGGSTWTNVVTACNPCNTRKGGRLPGEASMRLMREPRAPRRNPFLQDRLRCERYLIWRDFLRDGDVAIDA